MIYGNYPAQAVVIDDPKHLRLLLITEVHDLSCLNNLGQFRPSPYLMSIGLPRIGAGTIDIR